MLRSATLNRVLVVSLDGRSGAGKSTLAFAVAGALDAAVVGTVALADRVASGEGGEMRRPRCVAPSVTQPSAFAGFRFPGEVILLAVRWYLRFGLSYRDLEELLAERGIEVDHVSLYRWVQRFTPLLIDAARPCRHAPGDRWFVDETYVKVAGRWRFVSLVSLAAGIEDHGIDSRSCDRRAPPPSS